MNQSLLYLAPQCVLPPMDGGSLRAWHLYSGIAEHVGEAWFLGREWLVGQDGPRKRHSRPSLLRDSKLMSSLWACLTGQDYWCVRHVGPGARAASQKVTSQYRPDCVILTCLYSLPLLSRLSHPMRLVVDTQNYDPDWFDSLAERSRNPLLRRLCQHAIRNSIENLRRLPKGTLLVHVSEKDAERYRSDRPDLEHFVVENGTTVRARQTTPDYRRPGKRSLLFVGSLSSRINQDALTLLAGKFWPALRTVADVTVAGSNPSSEVKTLCRVNGWHLYQNLSEAQLESLYESAHFAVLPFAYGEGSKLKLFEACGRGVPVLSTPGGVAGIDQLPPLVFVCDEPEAWTRHLVGLRALETEGIKKTIAFAEEYSWLRLAHKFWTLVNSPSLAFQDFSMHNR